VIPYRKFSDTLKNENRTCNPPKPPKAPKVEQPCAPAKIRSLGGLGALGGVGINSATWGDNHEERAAIAEHDGGAPRAWAEALARLDPANPPGDVPPVRWMQFIDDCGRFLDQGWAQRCAALGWGPLDLFGCDRERPWARIDHHGLSRRQWKSWSLICGAGATISAFVKRPRCWSLLWLLHGNKIVELHRDKAIIETRTGAHQTYRRRPVEVGRIVLAWELAS